jgi:hypothetical protein
MDFGLHSGGIIGLIIEFFEKSPSFECTHSCNIEEGTSHFLETAR